MGGQPSRLSEGKQGIFPSFFMAGFECSTFIWKDGKRRDYVRLTGHDRHLQKDYERVMDLGIGVVREAIRWPLVDAGNGRYDWSSLTPVLEAANACHLSVIWDLCHYGFPDGFDPFADRDTRRFRDYCRAAAEVIKSQQRGPYYFTPVNEITFFSGAATDMGWMYPFAKGRYKELKQALCRMAIAGVQAIREVLPEARMVHVDPIIYEVPEEDDPALAKQAWEDTYEKAYEAWDMLAGKLHPELGGAPEILDIVGVNVYSYCEAQIEPGGKREALSPRDPRRKPLSEMLRFAWNRYQRPILIGETSGYKDTRAEWLDMVMQESLKACNDGIDLQGICLFPCVDMPDWQSGQWANIGIYDVKDPPACERVPCEPYIQELRRWQRMLERPENIEPEELEGHARRVDLEEVRRLAQEWERRHGPDSAPARPEEATGAPAR